jgi:hypothetical protein
MPNIFELKNETTRRIVIELLNRKRQHLTRRSTPIRLGSKSEIIIDPTLKDVENKTVLGKTKKVSKCEMNTEDATNSMGRSWKNKKERNN